MTLYKALIRSKLTYACPTWESAADTHLMKLQRLQNTVAYQNAYRAGEAQHRKHKRLKLGGGRAYDRSEV
jgi:hypothetical protein